MKTFHIGFTGAQQGMTPRQKSLLAKHLRRLAKKHEHITIHHGDCVGADEEFHEIALAVLPAVQVVLHPPQNPSKRAFCTAPGQIERVPDEYLKRNHAIVEAAQGMFAAPKGSKEELRSGTWATVRYARKLEKPLIMLFPEA